MIKVYLEFSIACLLGFALTFHITHLIIKNSRRCLNCLFPRKWFVSFVLLVNTTQLSHKRLNTEARRINRLLFSLQQMCAGKHSGSVAYARREKLQYQLWRLQPTPERLTTFTVWENQLLLKHWSTTKQLLRNRVNQCWIIMLLRKQKKNRINIQHSSILKHKTKTLNNHKNCFYLFIETWGGSHDLSLFLVWRFFYDVCN